MNYILSAPKVAFHDLAEGESLARWRGLAGAYTRLKERRLASSGGWL